MCQDEAYRAHWDKNDAASSAKDWEKRAAEMVTKCQDIGSYKPGWGDNLEQAISKFPKLKKKLIKWIGENCGCPERKEKLNKLGRWFNRVTSRSTPPAPN